MTDPNSTRSHYRRTSERLARRKRLLSTLRWMALWLIAGLVALVISL